MQKLWRHEWLLVTEDGPALGYTNDLGITSSCRLCEIAFLALVSNG